MQPQPAMNNDVRVGRFNLLYVTPYPLQDSDPLAPHAHANARYKINQVFSKRDSIPLGHRIAYAYLATHCRIKLIVNHFIIIGL